MAIILNKLTKLHNRFSFLLLLVYALSCKNETASKQTDCMPEKQKQKNGTTANASEKDQKSDVITSAVNSKKGKNYAGAMASNHPHESSKNHLKHTNQVTAEPNFTLKDITQNHTTAAEPNFSLKDITIKAGTQQSITLEVAATTAVKGYTIKSIAVIKKVTKKKTETETGKALYCTNQFDNIKDLEKKEIPPDGLPILLAPKPTLKPGFYQLKLKTGKAGKGTQQTEQWVYCTIDII